MPGFSEPTALSEARGFLEPTAPQAVIAHIAHGASDDAPSLPEDAAEVRRDTDHGEVTFEELRNLFQQQALEQQQPQLEDTELRDHWRRLPIAPKR